jgi:LmbE family N-acetylglucosaminyl deacetylase
MEDTISEDEACGELDGLACELRLQQNELDRGAPWIVIAAHPDDETIGASWIMRRAANLHVLHVTDGAPADPALRSARATMTRAAYASVRAAEVRAALAVVRGSSIPCSCLGIGDQESAYDLVMLTRLLVGVLDKVRPACVVTHPYEGGHPDHDATAFGVHWAAGLVTQARRPALIEMTSYNSLGGVFRSVQFLPSAQPVSTRILNRVDRRSKARMLSCFTSQADVLTVFRSGIERFRRAPSYDFRHPPHPGEVNYDRMGWPMTSRRFCELADAAIKAFGGTQGCFGAE